MLLQFPHRIYTHHMHSWRNLLYHELKITESPDQFCLLILLNYFNFPALLIIQLQRVPHSKTWRNSYSVSPLLFSFPQITIFDMSVHFLLGWSKTNISYPSCACWISVPFMLKPVGKCLKGFGVSSVVLLCELKQRRPCEIWVDPWVATVH